MGLSNHGRYTVSEHAVERYMERVRSSMKEKDIIKDIAGMLGRAIFIAKEAHGREMWLAEEENIVLIIAPKYMKVITLYKNEGKVTSNRKLDVVVNQAPISKETSLHERAAELLSEFAEKAVYQETKRFYAILSPLYKEYGERMMRLSGTKNRELYEEKTQELDNLRATIAGIEKERREVVRSLGTMVL